MSKNKQQHYIPRLIMKRFTAPTSGGERIFCFQRGGTSSKAVGISQAAADKYFYRDNIDPHHPDSLDEYLNQTERRVGPVIAELCDDQRVPPRESDEFNTLMRFIHDVYFRTAAHRAQLVTWGPQVAADIKAEKWFADHAELFLERLQQLESSGPEEKYIAELFRQRIGEGNVLSESSQKVLHARSHAKPRLNILAWLRSRYWRILVADGSGPRFIIGDDPVVIHADYGKVRTGLKHPTSRVTFPLSPTIALQGCYTALQRESVTVNDRKIREINGVVGRVAYKEVYSSTPDFEWWHRVGTVYTSSDWMKGIPEATWASTPE